MDDMTEAMQSETDKARLRSEIADLKRDLAAIAKTLSDKGIEFIGRFYGRGRKFNL